MVAIPLSERGLWEASIFVPNPKGVKKKFTCLVDTGASVSCATYRIITWAKLPAKDFRKVILADQAEKHVPHYFIPVRIDGQEELATVARLNDLPDGIDFILGNDVLGHFNVSIKGSRMEIRAP